MRPVALSMVGFGTFADAVTIDFEGVDVFALVGPTGSGKSTVIDAICFALYGSVPRYDDERVVAPVVHALANEAKVDLTFEIGTDRYRALRIVRRDPKGRATTRDVRLEVIGGEVLAATVKEMPAAVQALLGLDFGQFTRAVVLPQGEFARFLHDSPKARQDLLQQLLGLEVYERMMQRARVRAAEIDAAIAADRGRLAALADATPSVRAALVARAEALDAARARWVDVATAAAELTVTHAVVTTAAQEARRRLDALASVAAPRGLAEVAGALRDTTAAVVAAREARTRAEEQRTRAESSLATGPDRVGLVQLGEAHARAVALRERIAADEPRVDELGRERDEAERRAVAAEARMEELRTANAAWVVRSHLVPGESCPACDRVVTEVPGGEEPVAWTSARDAARVERERADAARTRSLEAGSLLAGRREQLAEQDAALADAPDAAAVAAELTALDAMATAVDAARRDEEVARQAERAAEQRQADARGAAQGARTSYRDARDRLLGSGLAPDPETDDLGADWETLLTFTTSQRPGQEEATRIATAEAARVDEELAAIRRGVADEAVALGLTIDGSASPEAVVATADAAAARARDDASRVAAAIDERERLEASIGVQDAERVVAEQLATLLDARHFEQWLVAEAFARLVLAASTRFAELSAGRFSFVFEEGARDLLVVDHGQGDERRSVRTLSGGETFQASLALALALSDELAGLAAGGAGRLESIFLDEGFGTLDADTLEVVAATIENLGVGDRMVGIVTHVAELAARMPVQFRVARHGRGATVERVDG